ncbi:head GIN domain-containing protein [Arenibacter echinorum]|uniref:Putative autotransporter adhesin-like protein n=1 Tax=Arenibacter echinorum TaxID=440515 RepID=A0A327RI35_9FLAO|nr:head GIN domain-containing protein [Arenibacter echinorum]RAJ15662.1 putative autotransporter adhesin-like protein [Arenibacter echinorum]
MKHLTTTLLSLFIIGSFSAQRNDKINGSGNQVTLVRTTKDYDQIAISGFFDIELVDGKEGMLTLEGEQNILDHIITEVKGDKLTIKVKNGYNLNPTSWKRGVSITIPVESISALSLSGSGEIVGKKTLKANNFETAISGSGDIIIALDVNSLKASMSGSGDMALSGKASDFVASISGSGDINAYDLIADNVDATVSGSANVKVTAIKEIIAKVSGSGDIDYRGNPERIDTKVSGSGDITQH